MNFNAQIKVNTVRLGFLFSLLATEIVNSAGRRLDELNKMMPLSDGKERSKIREKKLAHGLKEGSDTTGNAEEVYGSQAVEGILSMLDYLISLGDQDSGENTEKQNPQTEYDYDFDAAYAEYLNEDVDYDEDDDLDEDEQHFGVSM